MEENFFILRRTDIETKIFGGDVFIDLDGRNIGILKHKDLALTLEDGEHVLKMYKSHKFGTFIGTAESKFKIKTEEKLFARYSAPLIVNQSGVIIISKFESQSQLDRLSAEIANELEDDYIQEEVNRANKEEEIEKSNNTLIILVFVIPSILAILYWIISMSYLW